MPEAPSLSEAEKLLATMSLVPPREPGEKLRAVDEARLLEWHTAGQSQTDIARAIGCHQIHGRTLAEYSDSRPLARKYLEARALEMTKRLVEDPSPEAILKALGKLDVVREETAGGGTNIVIAVGQPGHSLESPRVPKRKGRPADCEPSARRTVRTPADTNGRFPNDSVRRHPPALACVHFSSRE